MKKLMMIAAMMVASLSASAQNDDLKNEIGVYYGFGSASTVVSTIATSLTAFSSGDQRGFWGPIGLEYYYHVSPVVGVGAMASIAGCKWGNDGEQKTKYITVMPAVKFNWLRKNHFGMYSGLAAGLIFTSISSSKGNTSGDSSATNFMAQITALGAEFGGQQLRGFAELGFGERGVLTVGLRYKF
ncbi:MAG: hypothetical protein IKM77_05890 [Prevotella sp.]|jgi:hypothetical protein|nr:hypothetical protein [Prevotella sp.]